MNEIYFGRILNEDEHQLVVWGKTLERERIIQYLDRTYDWNQALEFDRDQLIAIIQGEAK